MPSVCGGAAAARGALLPPPARALRMHRAIRFHREQRVQHLKVHMKTRPFHLEIPTISSPLVIWINYHSACHTS